jgi:hypothetical protein
MKKILLLAATAFAFNLAVKAQNAVKPEDLAKVNQETHDFGNVKQGTPVAYEFEIKNISDKALVVESATASCGCTVPQKPEAPIEPGKTGKLRVQYNAAAAAPFQKDVYVKLAGTDQMWTLHIKGTVMTAEEFDKLPKDQQNTKAQVVPATSTAPTGEKPKN